MNQKCKWPLNNIVLKIKTHGRKMHISGHEKYLSNKLKRDSSQKPGHFFTDNLEPFMGFSKLN